MKRNAGNRIFSIAALFLCAVLILFRTAFLSCASEDETEAAPALSVRDITLFSAEDGKTVSEENGAEWFRYFYEDRLVLAIRDEEGEESFFCGFSAIPERESPLLTEEEPQTAEHPWEIGEHRVRLECGSLETVFTVRVLEKEIQDIVPEEPVLLPAQEDPSHEPYDLSELQLRVFYKDSERFDRIMLSDVESEYLSGQEEEPWEPGMHTVTFRWQSFEGSFDAEITEAPVRSWSFTEEEYWIPKSAALEGSENESGSLCCPEDFLKISVVRWDGMTEVGTLRKIAGKFRFDYRITTKSGGTEMRFRPGETAELSVRALETENRARIRISEYDQAHCPHTHPEENEEIPADCTHPGWTAYTRCRDCGMILSGYRTKLPEKEHRYMPVLVLRTPSCEDSGEGVFRCAVCGEEFTQEIRQKGHDFGAYKIIKEATEDEEGLQRAVCTRCGKVKEEVLPKLKEESSDESTPDTETASEESGEDPGESAGSSEEPPEERPEESGSEEASEDDETAPTEISTDDADSSSDQPSETPEAETETSSETESTGISEETEPSDGSSEESSETVSGEEPTEKSSESSSEEPTEAPSEPSSEASSESLSETSSEPTTEALPETSSEITTEAAETSAEEPTEVPTESASERSTEAPFSTETAAVPPSETVPPETTAAPPPSTAREKVGSEQAPIDVVIRSGEEAGEEGTAEEILKTAEVSAVQESLPEETDEEKQGSGPGILTPMNRIIIGIGILAAVLFFSWIIVLIVKKRKRKT